MSSNLFEKILGVSYQQKESKLAIMAPILTLLTLFIIIG